MSDGEGGSPATSPAMCEKGKAGESLQRWNEQRVWLSDWGLYFPSDPFLTEEWIEKDVVYGIMTTTKIT